MNLGDVVKIVLAVAPLIEDLINRGVPKKVVSPYTKVAKNADVVMQSLQDLAIKIKQTAEPIDVDNFKKGVEITETMLKSYLERLEFNKKLSGLY